MRQIPKAVMTLKIFVRGGHFGGVREFQFSSRAPTGGKDHHLGKSIRKKEFFWFIKFIFVFFRIKKKEKKIYTKKKFFFCIVDFSCAACVGCVEVRSVYFDRRDGAKNQMGAILKISRQISNIFEYFEDSRVMLGEQSSSRSFRYC